jgi:hypothetical protein
MGVCTRVATLEQALTAGHVPERTPDGVQRRRRREAFGNPNRPTTNTPKLLVFMLDGKAELPKAE